MPLTITEVIAAQVDIIREAIRTKSRIGYFASLYMHMTHALRDGAEEGGFRDASGLVLTFDDSVRMQRLCTLFASRYLDALQLWQNGERTSRAWDVAFEETRRNNITAIQHLLCGINAHINLDLAIAAAETCKDQDILSMKSDFDVINTIIASLTNTMKRKLHKLSWPMKMLDDVGQNYDDDIAHFSICAARDEAWRCAVEMHGMSDAQRAPYIHALDERTACLGERIISPGLLPNVLLKSIKTFEPSDPAQIIVVLRT